MWQAFVTGFAKQTSATMQERNKEIKQQIQQSLIEKDKQNEDAKKRAEKEYTSRAEVARKASTLLSDAKVPADQREKYLIAFVENPDRFAQFEEAVLEGRTGVDSIGDFIVLPKSQEQKKPPSLEQVLSGFKARPKAGATAPDYSQTRTVFGLSAEPTARAARTEAKATLGMTEEEALGLEYTSPAPTLSAQFNFSTLLKENTDSLDKRLNKANLALLDATTPQEKTKARAEVDRILAVKSVQQKKEGGEKESDIRSNYRILSNTIMESLAGPGDLVRDAESGALIYSRTAPPEVRARIEEQKRQAFMASELTKSYKLPDGSLPPEVTRVISSFTYTTPAAGGAGGAPSGTPGAPAPAKVSDIEREKSLAYAAIAAAKNDATVAANVRRKFKQKTGQDLP